MLFLHPRGWKCGHFRLAVCRKERPELSPSPVVGDLDFSEVTPYLRSLPCSSSMWLAFIAPPSGKNGTGKKRQSKNDSPTPTPGGLSDKAKISAEVCLAPSNSFEIQPCKALWELLRPVVTQGRQQDGKLAWSLTPKLDPVTVHTILDSTFDEHARRGLRDQSLQNAN